MKRKDSPRYLDFSHRKLNKKSRMYRHEVVHLTRDMLSIVIKINQKLAVCENIIRILGSRKQVFKIKNPVSNHEEFSELHYHIENFIYRVHSYRDKVCMFINHVMRIGYSESDEGLLNKLIANDLVKQLHIDTELKRFQVDEVAELLNTRKSMSHRLYYDTYNLHFMPDINPEDVGYYKTSLVWRTKIKKDVSKIDDCMEKMFDINTNLSEKLLKFLNEK